jgi:hypothetical protein
VGRAAASSRLLLLVLSYCCLREAEHQVQQAAPCTAIDTIVNAAAAPPAGWASLLAILLPILLCSMAGSTCSV